MKSIISIWVLVSTIQDLRGARGKKMNTLIYTPESVGTRWGLVKSIHTRLRATTGDLMGLIDTLYGLLGLVIGGRERRNAGNFVSTFNNQRRLQHQLDEVGRLTTYLRIDRRGPEGGRRTSRPPADWILMVAGAPI